ncbi:MAG: hypothetical protein ACXW1W_14840, partial [Methylococcaceae bacterium]
MKKIVKSRLKKTRSRSKEKSIVIVLGMHRSGVSVVVRGLEALGVDFCDRLLTLESSNNDKSFVEEINVINCNVGKLLGQNWRKLAVEKSDELIDGKYADLNLQAFELLQSHLKSSHCLGLSFLQPAVLPFWQKVFAELDVNLTYIIVVRNPLSVADSLGRIASFAPEKCHYLWLEHILSSLYFTQRASRVIVDYDDLLDQPHKQISKIASTLELEHKPNKADLVRFSQEFLDANLRLANYKKQDVFADSLAPIPVKTAVRILDDIASDKLSLDSE